MQKPHSTQSPISRHVQGELLDAVVLAGTTYGPLIMALRFVVLGPTLAVAASLGFIMRVFMLSP